MVQVINKQPAELMEVKPSLEDAFNQGDYDYRTQDNPSDNDKDALDSNEVRQGR